MYSTYDDVFDAALSLPPGLRAMLAEHLFKSLDAHNQAEVDSTWAEEAEARIQDIEQGKVVPISGEEVFRELRARRK